MSIESTQSLNTDDSEEIYVILWFWKEQPGGDLVGVFFDRRDAHDALYILEKHGDPAKSFELVVV